MGKRLFIAVDIDEPTREQVGRISSASARRASRPHESLVGPSGSHAPDAALLRRRRRRPRAARARCARRADRRGARSISRSRGWDSFRSAARLACCGSAFATAWRELRRIQQRLSAGRCGVSAEPRRHPFTPHLTLARFRDRVPRARLAEISRYSRPSRGPSRIDRVTLYESRLSPAGPTYLPLAEALLTTVTAQHLSSP